jgi:hypothetical protein
LGFSHTDQKSRSTTQILSEAHTFTTGAFENSFFLNALHVNPLTIQVFNQGRTILYVRDQDYSVEILGPRTLIRLILTSPNGLTPGSQVIVDYEAAPGRHWFGRRPL